MVNWYIVGVELVWVTGKYSLSRARIYCSMVELYDQIGHHVRLCYWNLTLEQRYLILFHAEIPCYPIFYFQIYVFPFLVLGTSVKPFLCQCAHKSLIFIIQVTMLQCYCISTHVIICCTSVYKQYMSLLSVTSVCFRMQYTKIPITYELVFVRVNNWY